MHVSVRVHVYECTILTCTLILRRQPPPPTQPCLPDVMLLTWDSMRLPWNGNEAESASHSRSRSSDCADERTIVPALEKQEGGREGGREREGENAVFPQHLFCRVPHQVFFPKKSFAVG